MVLLTQKQCSLAFLINLCIIVIIIQYRYTSMLPIGPSDMAIPQQVISKTQHNIHILLCSDEEDRLAMYTLINSIIINEMYIDRLYFHILVLQNVPLFHKEFVQYFSEYLDRISFEFKSIIDEHPECVEYNNIASAHIYKKLLNHPMNFARFCLPNIFKHVSVGIYFDVDMVAQDSVSKLYDKYYNTHNYKVWSVMNRDGMRITRKSFADSDKVRFINKYINNDLHKMYESVSSQPINLANIGAMFNGGILMFDLDVWRECQLTQQSLELFKFDTVFKKKWHDRPWYGVTQPVINMLFIINNLQIGELDKNWNFVVSDYVKTCAPKIFKSLTDKRKFAEASIIHWAGTCKPWIESNAPLTRLWIKYIPQNADIWKLEKELNITLI